MKINILCLAIFLMSCTAQQIKQVKTTLGDYVQDEKLSTEEVVKGLKEALAQGADRSTGMASQVNGYLGNPKMKIPFPPDAQQVENKLREIGLGKDIDRFIETLNRGAEEAAKEAKPIFVNAISSMTIQDAWSILKGSENAATRYLQQTTTTQLTASFNPVIKRSLDKTNATKYYSDLVNAYNKIPFVEKVNPKLDEFATSKAIEGLFILVAEEEKNIRQNPASRTTELLKRVFKEQD